MTIGEEFLFRVRQATDAEVEYHGEPLNLAEDFEEALNKGHVIDAFSSGGGVRVVRIFERRDSREDSPKLGYGEDAMTEAAFRRARDTYRKREELGHPAINFESGDYPEVGIGFLTGGKLLSDLDLIVGGGFGLRVFRDGEEVIAQTEYGLQGSRSVEGRGENTQVAIDRLIADFEES